MLKKIPKEWQIVTLLAIIKLIVHFLTNTNYELQRDAFLYYSLGEHPAWGYVSVPPFIGVVSGISTFLFGNTVFALRFFPALVGSISVFIIAGMVRELKGGVWATIIALAAFLVSPAFLRSNTLFQPVSFNQFFWLLSGYLLLKLVNSHNPKYWITIFLVWGIAFLNKYSMAFFIVAACASLLLTKHRKLLFNWYFCIGGMLGAMMILPNLLWQHNHNWPLIHHMNELKEQQFAHVTIAGFFIDQVFMNLPGLVIWLSGLFIFLFKPRQKPYRFLAYTYLFTVLIIISLRGKSYYTLGLYPILFAMGGYAIDLYYHNYLKYGILVLTILLCIPLLPFSLPVFSHEKVALISQNSARFTNRWEDGKIHNIPQDYADMTGWKELASIVIKHYNSLPQTEQKKCMIYADNYGQAGAVNFYGKKHGLPDPLCFSDNFLLWAPDSIENAPLIYINHQTNNLSNLYNEIELVGVVDNEFFREDGVKVYYCIQPVDSLHMLYAHVVGKMKRKYKK